MQDSLSPMAANSGRWCSHPAPPLCSERDPMELWTPRNSLISLGMWAILTSEPLPSSACWFHHRPAVASIG